MRQTKLSKALLETLGEYNLPLSVPDILRHLQYQYSLTPNKTTIYRQLQKLTQTNQIEEVSLKNNITHYELKNNHHHHFMCNSCDDIQCLNFPELEEQIHQLESSLQESGLKIHKHQFSISGVCQNCTK